MVSKKYARNAAAGQLPLLVPSSTWICPTDLPDLRNRGDLAADLETKDDGLANGRGPGWVYRAGYICGAVLAAEGVSIYAPVRHPEGDCLDEDAVRRWYNDHMRCGARVFFQNAPYDLGWAKTQWDINPPDVLEDTMGMANILDENRMTYNLDDLCRWMDVPGKDEELLREAASCYGVDAKSGLHRLPARYAAPYAMQDGSSTLLLGARLEAKLREESLWDAYRLEADIIPMVVEMRRRGIRIDVDGSEKLKKKLLARRDEILSELSRRMADGRQVTMKDVKSDSWLVPSFRKEGIPVPALQSGKPSFDSEWMEKRDHWLPKLVAEARKYHDAGDKFVGNYIQGFTHMGRIHAEVHQYKDDRGGTKTSRFSYSEPPLQQMPSRDEIIAPQIRKLFLPEHGEVWGSLDYSQQEYRLIVHFAFLCHIVGAEMAVKIYRENPAADFHQIVVDLTGLIRSSAKDANFAKAYRAGVPKFALMIDKSIEEAAAIYQIYDDKLPFVSRMGEFCDSRAQKIGFLKLIDGAKAHFDQWEPRWIDREKYKEGMRLNKPMAPCDLQEAKRRAADPEHPWYREKLRRAHTYKAMNKLIQGSAARQTKIAMRECWRAGVVPKIQMHDELGFSFNDRGIAERMAEIMKHAVELCIPVMVDQEYGVNWGSAAKIKDKNKVVTYGATWDEAWDQMKMAA